MYWYYGTFTKSDFAPASCLKIAKDSFGRHNLNVFLPSEGYTTIGGAVDCSVIVQVTCVPQNVDTWVVVTAFSDDDNLAQTMKNNVQSDVQAGRRID
jgi:hypothetical protein